MIAPFTRLLADADERRAVGAFTCYDLETAAGVLRAAEQRSAPVILLLSEKSFESANGRFLAGALRAVAEQAVVPVSVQLDHVTSLELISRAFELGVCAVLADGSRLPYSENVEFVRRAVEIAKRHGGDVEAELGRVEGDEDIVVASSLGALTDPPQARDFVCATGASCLAVSIGNVHGVYASPPRLDWRRLSDIHAGVSVPLALHGASGLTLEDLRQAVDLGIRKVNFNTELRKSYVAATIVAAQGVQQGHNLLALHLTQSEAVASTALDKIDALTLT